MEKLQILILLLINLSVIHSLINTETPPEQCTYSLTEILEMHIKDKYYAQLQQDYATLQEEINLIKVQINQLIEESNTPIGVTVSKQSTCSVNDKTDSNFPKDCTELFKSGNRTTGIYYIQPEGSPEPFKVFCELAYEGWTVFQRHEDPTTDFQRTWEEYKEGFGDLLGDHWLGNEKIHQITSQGSYIMRAELPMTNNHLVIAEYDGFMVEAESSLYKLNVGTSLIAGPPGYDSILKHDNSYFSTWDNDNDRHLNNCALTHKGGWWFSDCYYANVNGFDRVCGSRMCGYWHPDYFIKSSVLKMKRKE